MYSNAQYVAFEGKNICIRVDINDQPSVVPCDPANTDYANLMALIAEGKLTIAPANAEGAN